ncbi:MAG: nucleotidyltransferase domain-containing protein [bacterium]
MDKKQKNIKLINHLEDFFEKNAKKFNIETAFLFGSQAGGFPTENSDIDIGIVFNNNKLSDDDIFLKITDISFEISGIVNSDINIIPVYYDFRKPLLYYNVIVLGKPLYIGNFDRYISLKNEAIFQMEDFSIFGEKWMIEIAKNKLKEIINA